MVAFLPFLCFLSFCYLYWSWRRRAKRSDSHHLKSHPENAKGKPDDEIELHETHPTKAMQKEDHKTEIRGILSQEMIADILTRLPVKSLIRFNALSKGFNSLFRSPNFITEHSHFSNQSPSLFLHRVEREGYNRMKSISTLRFVPGKTLSPSIIIDSPSNITLPVEQAFPVLNLNVEIEGSSNGLLCLTTKSGSSRLRNVTRTVLILIWNPSTRQVKRLPEPNSILTSSTSFSIGFTSAVNDYKVVLIQPEITEGFEVYSLKTGAWARVDVASGLRLHDASVCSYFVHSSIIGTGTVTTKFVSTNGSCFGLITESRSKSEADNDEVDNDLDISTRLDNLMNAPDPDEWIICFDLGAETFTKINMPNAPPLDQRILARYKDSIALLVNHQPVDPTIDLWVHDKGEDCLTMLYSVTLNRPEILVGLWKDDVLIIKRESNEKAVFCTNNGEEKKILATIEFQLKFSLANICVYIESLASI